MYRTCLFCHKDLGHNEVIEALPIGRRLAYDVARGRLWVVCRACERWNLTPFEERWEAIEACERAYREARRRFATDQIGIARLTEGLELVRIGEPLRPEFAAWRYGDQFGRRRRRDLMAGTAVVAASVGLAVVPYFAVGVGVVGQFLSTATSIYSVRRKVAVIQAETGTPIRLNLLQARAARFGKESTADNPILMVQPATKGLYAKPAGDWLRLEGRPAISAAARVLFAVNVRGGRAQSVAAAAARLDQLSPGESMFGRLAIGSVRGFYQPGFGQLPLDLRLALEMAVNEDRERVWLAGELLDLEQAWRQAEELAAIADSLGTEDLTAQLEGLKDRGQRS